ncbi:TPA: hypothetical protein GRI54_15610 [Vibrio parahaemolyticus]|uniref:hypothetical protein n=1 Tax=Vibrio parahaemolyticus TaxID=670 RepID=UPI0004213DAD|nr:hypothetical protein [Vibrio parahaemolyticus]EGR1176043.1 hypothetical protein [Vibrio parahaemolyticus]KHF12103.1 hypothetical protein PO80_24865 [Vibrio parahaemolyticus]MBM5086462.1 hypothetical protein [Vibrio parahaemolyticus]MDF4376511.1 hypothetical protein [Vibrio parahaemolyticus]OTW00057.1 hypothetical protein BA739_20010 [Vibrio parahaemolyticus]
MLTNKQAVAAIEQLRLVLDLHENVDVLAELDIALSAEWVQLEDHPNYEQNQRTKAVRNIMTRRVLKSDNKGYVKCKSRLGKWNNIKANRLNRKDERKHHNG